MLDVRRREFITLLGGAAAWPWPLGARAQHGERVRRIGFLRAAPPPERELAAFKSSAASRNLQEYYLYENEEKQDYTAL